MKAETIKAHLASAHDVGVLFDVPTNRRINCPFPGHDSNSRSFSLVDGSNGPRWYCPTRCGQGDAVDFAGRMSGLDSLTDFPRVLAHTAALLGLSDNDAAGLTPAELDRIEAGRRERAEEAQSRRRKRENILRGFMRASDLGGDCLNYLKFERGCWEPKFQYQPATDVGLGTYWDGTLARLAKEHGTETISTFLGAGQYDRLAAAERDFRAHPLLAAVTTPTGEVVAVQGRSIDPNCPKARRYTSRGEARLGFFGGRDLSQNPEALVVLTEGVIDCLSLRVHAKELAETWGPFIAIGRAGASGGLSAAQTQALAKRQVLLAFDGDEAGQTGAQHAANALQNVATETNILGVPAGADLNHLTSGAA